ncbi:unnamed protein product, partial [Mesorhabditis belari]|uniref:Uncharacterized protein n=1 Tax=Mesorhabditis belari TaxID=2138241 RepID=A0AAF3E9E4_9BILA
MSLPSAARGVSNVITRCEAAKETEFLDLSHCGIMYIADAIYLVLKGYEVTKVSYHLFPMLYSLGLILQSSTYPLISLRSWTLNDFLVLFRGLSP